jgi:hypothetical protein
MKKWGRFGTRLRKRKKRYRDKIKIASLSGSTLAMVRSN